MPDHVSLDEPALPHAELHVGYVSMLPLDRLMALRDALVALKGPLASEPGLQENLHRRFLNEETCNRVLGKVCCFLPS
nr:hypothetical protein [uncultured Pseudomonas sp.]